MLNFKNNFFRGPHYIMISKCYGQFLSCNTRLFNTLNLYV